MRKKTLFLPPAVLTGLLLACFAVFVSSSQATGHASEGLALLKSKGCLRCHTTNGKPLVGPSYKGIYGKKETVMVNGKPVVKTVDEKYLKFMITNPDVWVVKGYKPVMPKTPLTDEEVDAMIAYIKTLK